MTALQIIAALTATNTAASAGMALSLWKASRRRQPVLLRGAGAIARRVRLSPGQVDALLRAGQLPTFRSPGDPAPHATAAALDDWRRLWAGNIALASREGEVGS